MLELFSISKDWQARVLLRDVSLNVAPGETVPEFERAMIRERTMNGLAHARSAGRRLGRRPSLTGPQRAEIIAKVESGQGSPAQLASLFRVSRSTVQRVLRDYRARQETADAVLLSMQAS